MINHTLSKELSHGVFLCANRHHHVLLSFIHILKEYERGVIFTLGRFWKVKGPGLIIVIRGLQEMVRVDLRMVVMDVSRKIL